MFTSIKIENYKSCKLVELDQIGAVVALVGRNGSGKSNILKAIQWGAANAVSNSSLKLSSGDEATIEFVIKLEIHSLRYKLKFVSDEAKDSNPGNSNQGDFFLEESVEISENSRWKMIVRRQKMLIEVLETGKKLKIGPRTPCLPAIVALLPPDDRLVAMLTPLISFLYKVRYSHFDEPGESEERVGIFRGDNYKKWLENQSSKEETDNSVLTKILHMRVSDQDRFKELESLLDENGVGLLKGIRYEMYDRDTRTISQDVKLKHDDSQFLFLGFDPINASMSSKTSSGFEFRDLSLGTRRIIRILTSLVFDRSSVMLIEHPEDGIHAGMTKKIMGILRDYADPLQLFISSHSLTVFNTLSLEDVRFVTMVDGETRVRGLTAQELEAARKFISKEGDLADVIQSLEE